jgi:hypothetical protein
MQRRCCRSAHGAAPSVVVKPVDEALMDIAAKHHHLIGTTDAAAAGMTARQWQRRVRAGLWVLVAPGVWRHAATPETFDLRVRGMARALGRDSALAGAAAAAWWGLDGFGPDDEPVLFIVQRTRRWHRSAEVRTTRDWRTTDLMGRDGVRVTNVTRVVLDLAEFGESVRRIESAIDSGIRFRFTSVPTLQRRIAAAGVQGRKGMSLLRELMLDSGGESALERRFLRLMREAGMPRPRTQMVYARESGRAMRVDFEFPNGLIVEVSGRLGHTSDRDRQRDARRRNALKGRPFCEFTTADVLEDPAYVVSTVRERSN